jgi:hypothetical protein
MNGNEPVQTDDERNVNRPLDLDLGADAGTVRSTICFERLFKSSVSERDKFLARLFGLFSEDIVRFWCRNPSSPYEDLGRPTLKRCDEKLGKTLDFTFRRKADGHVFVGEMKCELEYDNYRCLTLTAASQLERHRRDSDAFRRFLLIARNHDEFKVTVGGRPVQVNGAILVWGRVLTEGRAAVVKETGLADALALDGIVGDLIRWKDSKYFDFFERRAKWCNELFGALAGSR